MNRSQSNQLESLEQQDHYYSEAKNIGKLSSNAKHFESKKTLATSSHYRKLSMSDPSLLQPNTASKVTHESAYIIDQESIDAPPSGLNMRREVQSQIQQLQVASSSYIRDKSRDRMPSLEAKKIVKNKTRDSDKTFATFKDFKSKSELERHERNELQKLQE